jgi:tetratricopeptide (TPR) repeat protein
MSSRLIERLDLAIARADQPVQRECLKAERGGVLARHGMLAEARFVLSGVRAQALRHRASQLSGWLALGEGLVEHFESMATRAHDEFQKAYAFGETSGDQRLQALGAAWLAIGCLNRSDLAGLQTHLGRAMALAAPDNHAAWSRLALVLADALRFAGDDDRSQTWYLKARGHAIAEADGSMMSVMLYNMAAMRSGSIGLDDAFGQADRDRALKSLIEGESTANYDSGRGHQSLTSMHALVRAQLLTVLERFDEAVVLFDGHLARAGQEGNVGREARFLADRAWCHARLGQIANALRDVRQSEAALPRNTDADDRAATHARIARVYQLCGQDTEVAIHQAHAEDALLEHRRCQQDMLAVMNAVLARRPG